MGSSSANWNITHYRIIERIGTGGMGEVYLAQDTKPDRKVALKLFPSHLAANSDRMERFIREAKSAAVQCLSRVLEARNSDGSLAQRPALERSATSCGDQQLAG